MAVAGIAAFPARRLEKKYANRLHKLADLLQADARKKKGVSFNLEYIGLIPRDYKEKQLISCDTQACAMGLAALSGKFKRAGLRWEIPNSELSHRYIMRVQMQLGYAAGNDDRYIRWGWQAAAMRIFGLNEIEMAYLFMSRNYEEKHGARAERLVAKRVRAMANGTLRVPHHVRGNMVSL